VIVAHMLSVDEIGAPNLPETAILYRDQIYGCYSEQGELRIRSGTLAGGQITWTQGHSIAPADCISNGSMGGIGNRAES
jgi:hypothetical protein